MPHSPNSRSTRNHVGRFAEASRYAGQLLHQEKMIGQEDVGVNLPARFGTSLAQRLDEALAIRIVLEDRLPPVPAIHDVIDRAGIFDSQLAGHAGKVPRAQLWVNIKNRPRQATFQTGELAFRLFTYITKRDIIS